MKLKPHNPKLIIAYLLSPLLLALLLRLPAVAQERQAKREVRAAWIATVENIDWPSRQDLSRKQQKRELLGLIDSMHALNINTIFFQIRPSADAFYRKGAEPWSEWLSGKQGRGKWYDPLKLAIKACHKRGMELHAWFNPFRAIHLGTLKDPQHRKHISAQHPEWMVEYQNKVLINPGIPQARAHVLTVIEEVAKNYEIDGVHIDDYFYPYPKKGKAFNDSLAYQRYGQGFESLGDWRRHNINSFVEQLGRRLRQKHPTLKFGVSPFGVWRNQDSDRRGSQTWAGMPSYDSLYADTRKWMAEGWVDYLVPQLYWSLEFKAAGFKELLTWWSGNRYDRHLYIGHAVYKIQNNADKSWDDEGELPKQIRLVRRNPHTLGSAFFRAGFLLQNPGHIKDSLQRLYPSPALPPVMEWKKAPKAGPPRKLRVAKKRNKTVIRWKKPQGENPSYYLIYRYPKGTPLDTSNPKYIYRITAAKTRKLKLEAEDTDWQYAVSSLDALWRESEVLRNHP